MSAREERFVTGPLPAPVEAALARLAEAPDVARIAVMPDVHLAEDVCVGTVLATRRWLYPAAVGGDIGCGVAAIRYDVPAETLDAPAAARVLAGLYGAIPRGRHREATMPRWPADLAQTLRDPTLSAFAAREGRAQLGTLGGGNHFVELQRDEEGALWLLLHSGSRGIGPKIRAHHERRAQAGRGGLAALDAASEAGCAYLEDVEWAIAYARANRRLMLEAVHVVMEAALGASPAGESLIECDHNHVRREVHGAEPLWVHRKGAIPAGAGVPGVVPGSMGTPSFHVEGRGHAGALCSSAHGAGRAFSRTEARARISVRTLERQLAGVWVDRRRLRDLRDEAPGAYKDIGAVMRAQHDLTRIVRRLEPVLSFKGGG